MKIPPKWKLCALSLTAQWRGKSDHSLVEVFFWLKISASGQFLITNSQTAIDIQSRDGYASAELLGLEASLWGNLHERSRSFCMVGRAATAKASMPWCQLFTRNCVGSAHFQLRKEREDHTLQSAALVNEAYLRLVRMQSSAVGKPHPFFCHRCAAHTADSGRLRPAPRCREAGRRSGYIAPGRRIPALAW